MESRFFESLEARALLSAPVATVRSFALTADTMTLIVAYDADTGIDQSSIDTHDLGVTGPGVSTYAESSTILSQQATQTVVRYLLRNGPPWQSHGLWPVGAFILGIPAGEVRSADGQANVETGAGAYWLWFPDRYLEFNSMVPTSNGLAVVVSFWSRQPSGVRIPASVRVTGPTGQDVIQTQPIPDNQTMYSIAVVNAGERPWDFTDRGTFSIAVGTYDGGQLVGFHPAAQYWLWFSNPKVEILSTSFMDSLAYITARFTDDHAVDPSSITSSAVGVDVGPYHIPPAFDGTSLIPPQVLPQPDGSAIAIFARGWYQRSWSNRDSGEWRFVVNSSVTHARDVDGNETNVGVVGTQTHIFTNIAIWGVSVSATADDPTHVTFSVQLFGNAIDPSSFGDNDVRLELNGHTYQLSLLAAYPANDRGDPLYWAYYSLQLPQGERLGTGTANFYFNPGALTTSGLPSDEELLGSWWFWFN
jgi:hypothetical protein